MTGEREKAPTLHDAIEILGDARLLVHLTGMAAQSLDDNDGKGFAGRAIYQATRDIEAKIDEAMEIVSMINEAEQAKKRAE